MGAAAAIPLAMTVASSALQAGSQYSAAKQQAALGQQQAAITQEQIRVERTTQALKAKDEENQRQQRGQMVAGNVAATAAAFGFDAGASGSTATIQGESRRAMEGDISSIRLLGAAKQQQAAIQSRAAGLDAASAKATGQNAWIRPAATLLGAGLSTYSTWTGLGGATPPTRDPFAARDATGI